MLTAPPPTCRAVRLVGALLALALLLAGCGGGGGSAPPAEGGNTVQHKYGSTTVPQNPQRVVSLGYTDQDAILALGVVPVAIREFTGNKPSATWEWARDRLNGQQPQVLPLAQVGPETLAALRPDLIIGISAGLSREQYDSISRIAPTIASPAGFVDYGTPWQDATRLTGQALGKAAEADRLVADTEARIARARAAHPRLEGRTVAAVRPSTSDSASFFAYAGEDLRARFLTSLGLTIPQEFQQLAGQSFYAQISTEEIGKLNQADVLALITTSQAEIDTMRALPGYATLEPVRAGRVVTFDETQSAALSFSSVLSLPYVLDPVADKIATALR